MTSHTATSVQLWVTMLLLSLSDSTPAETPRGKPQLNLPSQAPLLRCVLTLSFLVATVAVGLYVM